MTDHLPTYEGAEPDGLRLAFSGTDDSYPDALQLGTDVTLLVHGKVTAAAYKRDQFGVLRLVQSVKISHALPAPQPVADDVAAEVKRRRDAEAGQTSLDDDDAAAIDAEVDA